MPECVSCVNWVPKKTEPAMVKRGYGACDMDDPWMFYNGRLSRECDKHIQAPEAIVAARIEFLRRLDNVGIQRLRAFLAQRPLD